MQNGAYSGGNPHVSISHYPPVPRPHYQQPLPHPQSHLPPQPQPHPPQHHPSYAPSHHEYYPPPQPQPPPYHSYAAYVQPGPSHLEPKAAGLRMVGPRHPVSAAIPSSSSASPVVVSAPPSTMAMAMQGRGAPPARLSAPSANNPHPNPPSNHIYVFTTELANRAADAMARGQCPSFVEFHRRHAGKHLGRGTAEVKKEASPIGAGGGSASSGYESSATPPSFSQQPSTSTSNSNAPSAQAPQTPSVQQAKLEPPSTPTNGSHEVGWTHRSAASEMEAPRSVPEPRTKTPLTPLGRANSVNPPGGPGTPHSVPPPTTEDVPTPHAPSPSQPPPPNPAQPPPQPQPASAAPSEPGDDPLSQMAKLAESSIEKASVQPPLPPFPRKRPAEEDHTRDQKMMRLEKLQMMLNVDNGVPQPQQQPGQPHPQQAQPQPQPGQPHLYPHPSAHGLPHPQAHLNHPPHLLPPNYFPHHPHAPPNYFHPRPGNSSEMAWQELREQHLMSQAQQQTRPTRAPRQQLKPSTPRGGARARMRAPPPPYQPPPQPSEMELYQLRQQHPAYAARALHPPRPPHPQQAFPPQPHPAEMIPAHGQPHPQQHPAMQPQQPPPPQSQPPPQDLDKTTSGPGPGQTLPTVNNTYVSATMSVQQLNLINHGPPLSNAQMMSGGPVSLSVQASKAPPHPHPHPPPPSQLRHPQPHPQPPPHPHPHHPHPPNGHYTFLHNMEQPITNLDSKVPSKTLSYRPTAPPGPVQASPAPAGATPTSTPTPVSTQPNSGVAPPGPAIVAPSSGPAPPAAANPVTDFSGLIMGDVEDSFDLDNPFQHNTNSSSSEDLFAKEFGEA